MELYKGLLALSLVLFAGGCKDGKEDTDDSDDTDTTETDETDTDSMPMGDKECVSGDTFEADGTISVTLGADGTQFATADANATAGGLAPETYLCGNTGSVVLNIYQTTVANGWDEEHDLANVDHDVATEAAAAWDLWSETLIHVETLGELDNTHTLFNTDDDPEGEGGNLTYVLRAYDGTNALEDCIVWGDDTAAVLAGFTSVNTGSTKATDDDVTSANCTAVTF